MAQPAVHMHGPEHHILVGSAIISTFHNCGGDVDLNAALDEMKNRGEQAPGGICGFWGCCGAAVSCGMAISIITGATPLSAVLQAGQLYSCKRCGGVHRREIRYKA